MSLNERIAALASKTSKPSTQPSPQSNTLSLPRSGGPSVKDKAAKFDHLGPAPAPRGSFGLGAPLSAGQKTNRELYGNRIPSVTRSRLGENGDARGPASMGSGLSSRSPSRSRKSSNGSNMDVDSRLEDAGPSEPLTEAAVGALPSSRLVDPLAAGAAQAFKSVPPSLAGRDDDDSSIAVERDNASTLNLPADGSSSPALTTSTISDTAMKAAPPVLSPVGSSMQLHSSGTLNTLYSNAATIGSSGETPDTLSGVSDALNETSRGVEDLTMSDVEEPKAAIRSLPLSRHLLNALEPSSPDRSGLHTPLSVAVETGSTVSKDADVGEVGDTPMVEDEATDLVISEADASSSQGDDSGLDVQPGLRLPAPILPLSSVHLRALNIRPSTGGSGTETPRSMAVEDGSDGGRSAGDINADDSIDINYIVDDMPTPPGVVVELPSEGSHGGAASPPPLSPAVLAYTQDDTPMDSPKESAPAAAPSPSLGVPQIPTIDMSTPVAALFVLPELQATPPAINTSDEFGKTPLAETAPNDTIKGRRGEDALPVVTEPKDEHSVVEQPNPVSNIHEMTSLLGLNAPKHPIASARRPPSPGRVLPAPPPPPAGRAPQPPQRLDTGAQYYLTKPLPAPPPSAPSEPSTPTPTSSLPETPIIISAFPSVPSAMPHLQQQSPSPLSKAAIISPPTIITPTGTRADLSKPYIEKHSYTRSEDASAFLAQRRPNIDLDSKARPHSTHDNASASTPPSLRRAASSLEVNGTQKRRKKPQLVPGVWIGDDDERDEDEDPGWVNIIVPKA